MAGFSGGAALSGLVPLDAGLSLALGMHANPGAYAVVAGSGVSLSSGMPSAWDVVRTLCNRVAAMHSAGSQADPIAWYRQEIGEEPTYTALLDRLAPTAAERSTLLRPFFEPTDEERAQGLKQPTATHRAIANLVSQGAVRLIVTTNFDRLFEDALNEMGIRPHVISSADDIRGAPPPIHSKCVIVKVHGDYLDTRTRNTVAELAAYDLELDTYLRRTLADFGIVVTGWSAQWDPALGEVLRTTPSPFSSYWTVRGELNEAAEAIAVARGAIRVPVSGADDFFTDLVDRVASLRDLAGKLDVDTATLIGTFKRLMTDSQNRIRMHDIGMREANALHERMSQLQAANPDGQAMTLTEAGAVAQGIPKSAERSLALFAQLGFWGEQSHDDLRRRMLERLGNHTRPNRFSEMLFALRALPATLALFVVGPLLVHRGLEGNLWRLIGDPVSFDENCDRNFLVATSPTTTLSRDLRVASNERLDPGQFILEAVRPHLTAYLPDDRALTQAFKRFELLYGLIHLDRTSATNREGWTYLGTIGGGRFWMPENGTIEELRAEVERAGADWPLLKAGLCNKDVDALRGLIGTYEQQYGQRRWR